MKKCKECGKEFTPLNPKGLFCSLSCRQKDYRKNIKAELQKLRSATVTIKESQTAYIKPESKIIPPIPERKDFADNWAYLEAKAIWKDKNQLL
ncbi:MAG: hypothetical protein ABUT20_43465, partial [Bacteroidota bacterium]